MEASVTVKCKQWFFAGKIYSSYFQFFIARNVLEIVRKLRSFVIVYSLRALDSICDTNSNSNTDLKFLTTFSFFLWTATMSVFFRALEIIFLKKTEVATVGVLWKNMFLKVSENLQKNTCVAVSFLETSRIWTEFYG